MTAPNFEIRVAGEMNAEIFFKFRFILRLIKASENLKSMYFINIDTMYRHYQFETHRSNIHYMKIYFVSALSLKPDSVQIKIFAAHKLYSFRRSYIHEFRFARYLKLK